MGYCPETLVCKDCGQEMTRLFSVCNIFPDANYADKMKVKTEKGFYYDWGLGKWIESRSDRKRKIAEARAKGKSEKYLPIPQEV